MTGYSTTLAYVDQGYTSEVPAEAAKAGGLALEVVKLPKAKKGFVARLCAVAAPLGGGTQFCVVSHFRRFAKDYDGDYERLPETLAGLHHHVKYDYQVFIFSNIF